MAIEALPEEQQGPAYDALKKKYEATKINADYAVELLMTEYDERIN